MNQPIVGVNGSPVRSSGAPVVNAAAASKAIKQLEVIDPDKIEATRFNILVRVVDVATMTEGGLFLPEAFFTKQLFDKTRAVLIKAGEEAFTGANGDGWGLKPEIGDTIIMSKNAGNLYRDEEFNLYRHAHDNDVCFVLGGNEK